MTSVFSENIVHVTYVCEECGERTVYDGNGSEMCPVHPSAKVEVKRAIYRLAAEDV